jgi:hypothetical protein
VKKIENPQAAGEEARGATCQLCFGSVLIFFLRFFWRAMFAESGLLSQHCISLKACIGRWRRAPRKVTTEIVMATRTQAKLPQPILS